MRVDGEEKATGRTVFTADVTLSGMSHVALVRSPERHARILSVDATRPLAMPGVVGVYTATDLAARDYGRAVRDIPVLAQGSVRFVGERVAAVVAQNRDQAAAAALCLDVSYAPLPPMLSTDGAEIQSRVRHGSFSAVAAELAASAFTVNKVLHDSLRAPGLSRAAGVSGHGGRRGHRAGVGQREGAVSAA